MSGVYENLTEAECALFAILQDPSGLDQAEFSYIDETNRHYEPEKGKDGTSCFRAWPFQWPWFRCMDELQLDQGSRSCGKSMSIKFRALAFPFVHPGEEMVITAPEGVHLDAVTDNIEILYENTRLAREMLAPGRGGIKHRPFHINFANGSRIMGRIPKHDGSGVKGLHPIWLELDEGQDYVQQGWLELIETVKDGGIWRAHGVTRGVRDKFYEYSQPKSGWTTRRLPAMYRPNWSDEEREKKIRQYGKADSPDFRRNVYGLHADETSPIFVLHRLMQAVDPELESKYNRMEYAHIEIDEVDIREVGNVLHLLDLPASHNKYKNFWIGMDVGWTIAPSAIVVFAEIPGESNDTPRLKLLARIMLKKVSTPDQVAVILHLMDLYRPLAFALDKTGAGFPLLETTQDLARQDPNLAKMVSRIKGYNFSEKIVVEFDDTVEIDEDDPEGYKAAEIRRSVLEASTDVLRQMVDDQRLLLPWDTDIIAEFQGQTYTYAKALDPYGRKKTFSTGNFHTLDACRMAALAYKQNNIEQFIKNAEDDWDPPPMIFL